MSVAIYLLLVTLSGIVYGLKAVNAEPSSWKNYKYWFGGMFIGAAVGGFGDQVMTMLGVTGVTGWLVIMGLTVAIELIAMFLTQLTLARLR